MKDLFSPARVSIAAAIALTALAPASASAQSASAACPDQTFAQPFSSWGDNNLYTLVPGQGHDYVDGTGWKLTGGVKLVSATLQDGQIGQVIDLRGGGKAVSPPVCVSASDYPQARAVVANIAGVQGVQTSITYSSNGKSGAALAMGNIRSMNGGWAVSKPIMLHSPTLTGQHLAQLTFTALGSPNSSEYQLYDVWVDPRMH